MSEVKPRKNRQHPEAFKQEAVALSYRIGVTKTARQLDIAQSLLYVWRKHYGQIDEVAGSDLVSENAHLKKLLAQKEEELAIVKRPQSTLRRSPSEVRFHESASWTV